LAAVSNNGWTLRFASDELKNDIDIVIKAVSNDGQALRFASNKWQEYFDLIKQIYKYKDYEEVCDYIKRTDEIKKFSYRIPTLDTKFRFI